eukprot:TRINITY_DN3170_c2_g1_i1.p1 TRINITY_DN3170_c2_g1~~TRINITY_DN3170_c2_g1_i1.p1  ORF type:complete len:1041 (+),score=333.67 TRINITY_DN3170_c2_g1_i1:276-3125(+)
MGYISYIACPHLFAFLSYRTFLNILEYGWTGTESYLLHALGAILLDKGELGLSIKIATLAMVSMEKPYPYQPLSEVPHENIRSVHFTPNTSRGWSAAVSFSITWKYSYATMSQVGEKAMTIALEQGEVWFYLIATISRHLQFVYDFNLNDIYRHHLQDKTNIKRVMPTVSDLVGESTQSVVRGFLPLNPNLIDSEEKAVLISGEDDIAWMDRVRTQMPSAYIFYCVYASCNMFILHPHKPQVALHYIHPQRSFLKSTALGFTHNLYYKMMLALSLVKIIRIRKESRDTMGTMGTVGFPMHEPDPKNPLPDLSEEESWKVVYETETILTKWANESPLSHFRGILNLVQAEIEFTKWILEESQVETKPDPLLKSLGLPDPVRRNEEKISIISDLYDNSLKYCAMSPNQKNYVLDVLVEELVARFWLHPLVNVVKKARIHLRNTYQLCQEWEAEIKLKNLRQEFPQILDQISTAPVVVATPRGFNLKVSKDDRDLVSMEEIKDQQMSLYDDAVVAQAITTLDLHGNYSQSDEEEELDRSQTELSDIDRHTIVQIAQSIIGEIDLRKLLSILTTALLRNTGSMKALLLSPRDETNEWGVDAIASGEECRVFVSKSSKDVIDPQGMDTSYSSTVLNFVLNSGRAVILADACHDQSFGRDSHIRSQNVRSILCMPLHHGDKLVSIVYLENQQHRASYTQQRLLICRIIVQQAAIAIDNARLYLQLEKSIKEANDANEAKSQFLANMSHEVRTPMNGVIGGIEILRITESNFSPEQKEALNMIRTSSESMLTLINDILDLSNLEMGRIKLNVEEFLIRPFVDTIVDIVQRETQIKQLDMIAFVDKSVPHLVKTDVSRLRQVILNLLSNAIKFTQVGEISLRVSAQEKSKGKHTILFTLRDSGIGIPMGRRPLLFRKFSQVEDNRVKQIRGTGLGLAISKSLVEMITEGCGLRMKWI